MVFPLCALAWLWFTLINHLRVAWSVNPQYAYGWAVPFLCGYLIWRKAESRKQKVETGEENAEIGNLRPEGAAQEFSDFSFSAFQLFSFSFMGNLEVESD